MKRFPPAAASVISIALILCLVEVTTVAGSQCISRDHSRMARLNDLNLLDGKTFVVTDDKFAYSAGICTEMKSTLQPSNASVIRTPVTADPKDPGSVLGRFNDTDIIVGERWIMLTYASGDVITTAGPCNQTQSKTLIIISCNSESRDIKFELADPLNLVCATVFHMTTSLVCPAPGQSGWTIFLMLLLTAALCYLIIGMAYRRFVTGAKGLEQIPNYNFWRNPCAYIQESMESRDPSRGRNQPWTQTVGSGSSGGGGSGESADEPLLHP